MQSKRNRKSTEKTDSVHLNWDDLYEMNVIMVQICWFKWKFCFTFDANMIFFFHLHFLAVQTKRKCDSHEFTHFPIDWLICFEAKQMKTKECNNNKNQRVNFKIYCEFPNEIEEIPSSNRLEWNLVTVVVPVICACA